MGGGWVYLDYRVSSGPFLRFSMSFEFLSEMLDHSVSETRDPSLTIVTKFGTPQINIEGYRVQKPKGTIAMARFIYLPRSKANFASP